MNQIAEALSYNFTSPNVSDRNLEPANVVDVLYYIAKALNNLGLSDASTDMGALEAHALAIKDGTEAIAVGLHTIAEAIGDLAAAVREHRTPPEGA
jgi:hypothetical protein